MGMDLAQDTQQTVPAENLGTAAGMIGGILAVRQEPDVFDPQLLQNGLHGALEGKEVHTVAVSAQREDLGLVGEAVGPLEVNPAQFIELGGLVAEVVVPGQDLQHGGQSGGAHDGGVLAQGVQNFQRIPQGGILGQVDLIIIGGADEGVGDDLVVPGGAAHAAQQVFRLLDIREATAGGETVGEGVGDVVVAVEPGYLLGDVGVVLHIGPPGGNMDGVALHCEVQRFQNPDHFLTGNVGAQQAVDLLRLQLHGDGIGVLGDDVHHALHHFAGAQQLHQLAGPLHGFQGVHGVQTLFIAGGSVGAHIQCGGGAVDRGAVEVGGFKEDHGGIAHNLAVGAAHDARYADGPVLIADAEHGGGQLPLIAVQRLNGLALPGGTDDDVAALYAGEVEGVHGLAVFQHHIVGDVHDVVDGADAGVPQPFPHPRGRGLDLHVLHHPGGVPGAEIAVLNVDVHQLRNGAAAALHFRGVQLQGTAEGGAGLPCEADNGQAVRPVGGDLKLHHVVVGTDDLGHVVAGLYILVQHEDTVGDAVGELLLLRVEILQRADGIGLGVVGHQIARMEVGAGGVERGGGAADVQRGVVQAVGLGLTFQHLAADHGAEHLVPGLDVGGDGELFGVDCLIIVQQGGGGDDGVGIVMLGGEAQLLQRAQHPVGHHAPELALFNFRAVGEQGLVLGHGHQIAHMDIPCAGDNLGRLRLSHVDLADPHVVAVRVLFHGQNLAHHHIFQRLVQRRHGFHLGAGEGHGLVKLPVADVGNIYKFI